jgi:hypothetical protein
MESVCAHFSDNHQQRQTASSYIDNVAQRVANGDAVKLSEANAFFNPVAHKAAYVNYNGNRNNNSSLNSRNQYNNYNNSRDYEYDRRDRSPPRDRDRNREYQSSSCARSLWCENCRSTTHSTNDCRTGPRDQRRRVNISFKRASYNNHNRAGIDDRTNWESQYIHHNVMDLENFISYTIPNTLQTIPNPNGLDEFQTIPNHTVLSTVEDRMGRADNDTSVAWRAVEDIENDVEMMEMLQKQRFRKLPGPVIEISDIHPENNIPKPNNLNLNSVSIVTTSLVAVNESINPIQIQESSSSESEDELEKSTKINSMSMITTNLHTQDNTLPSSLEISTPTGNTNSINKNSYQNNSIPIVLPKLISPFSVLHGIDSSVPILAKQKLRFMIGKHKKNFEATLYECTFCHQSGHTFYFCAKRQPSNSHQSNHNTVVDKFVELLLCSPRIEVSQFEGMNLSKAMESVNENGSKYNKDNPWIKSMEPRDQLRSKLGFWKAIGATDEVLSWLAYGIEMRFICEPGRYEFKKS